MGFIGKLIERRREYRRLLQELDYETERRRSITYRIDISGFGNGSGFDYSVSLKLETFRDTQKVYCILENRTSNSFSFDIVGGVCHLEDKCYFIKSMHVETEDHSFAVFQLSLGDVIDISSHKGLCADYESMVTSCESHFCCDMHNVCRLDVIYANGQVASVYQWIFCDGWSYTSRGAQHQDELMWRARRQAREGKK